MRHGSGRLPSGSSFTRSRADLGVITAKVQNVGEVYDEIDALLDEIERDEDIRAVAIYTLNGLFASLPIR